jgi:hypothetical protein
MRPDFNVYQQKLFNCFARRHFQLSPSANDLVLQTLSRFLQHILRRVLFFVKHRINGQSTGNERYDMTSNVREQMRFLTELHKVKYDNMTHADAMQRKIESNQPFDVNNEEQKRMRTRDYRLSIVEELRQKEADETACLVLRETRLKRQKLSANNGSSASMRIHRVNRQDLIVVMEDEPILKRSKTLLVAYANR